MTWLRYVRAFLKGGIDALYRERTRPRPSPEDAARDQVRVCAELDAIEAAQREAFERARAEEKRSKPTPQ